MTKESTLKFSQALTSPIVTLNVAGSKVFFVHSRLLALESERFSRSLNGCFKEASERIIEVEDESPELFGFFVEYIYRDRSILSREVAHYSTYVTLARLYAMGERLIASRLQAYCVWRFTELLSANTFISHESICELLQVACTEMPDRVREDPMKSHILWYGASKLKEIQEFDMFRQLLCDVPRLGEQLCLWVSKAQPAKATKPNEILYKRFAPESEYTLEKAEQVPSKGEP